MASVVPPREPLAPAAPLRFQNLVLHHSHGVATQGIPSTLSGGRQLWAMLDAAANRIYGGFADDSVRRDAVGATEDGSVEAADSNNATYAVVGALCVSLDEIPEMFFFSILWMLQALLALLRAHRVT